MINFLDLKKVNEAYFTEYKKILDDFLNSGHYILGEQVSVFEKEYASYCGTGYCVGVSNGLDAIRLIFEAYKLQGELRVGDEVLVPANTYIASILAISNAGLKPVLIDPNIETYNIDIAKLELAITLKTKAILGVHLYGSLYNVEALEHIAKSYDLLLIEDAAQAHGAVSFDGRKAGNVSNAAAFSFYPTKNLGALGDAGAITTNNYELAQLIFKIRNYGRTSAYKNEVKGFNCRLDELQAAFLRVKLKNLDRDNVKRQEIAKYYIANINSEKIILPSVLSFKEHVFHLFVIRCKKRDELKAFLKRNGVESFIHYPVPIHKQKAYSEFYGSKLPVTEQIHEEVLSLPLNPILTIRDIEKIAALISSF